LRCLCFPWRAGPHLSHSSWRHKGHIPPQPSQPYHSPPPRPHTSHTYSAGPPPATSLVTMSRTRSVRLGRGGWSDEVMSTPYPEPPHARDPRAECPLSNVIHRRPGLSHCASPAPLAPASRSFQRPGAHCGALTVTLSFSSVSRFRVTRGGARAIDRAPASASLRREHLCTGRPSLNVQCLPSSQHLLGGRARVDLSHEGSSRRQFLVGVDGSEVMLSGCRASGAGRGGCSMQQRLAVLVWRRCEVPSVLDCRNGLCGVR